MKRRILKLGGGLLALGGLIVVALGTTVQLRYDRTFDDVPLPEIRASDDSAVIAQGRYLAYGPAHCAYCHLAAEQWDALEAGERPPMSGGGEFAVPFGRFVAPNLTPDPETGIGGYTDGELARMLRHNIRPDGKAAAPFMEFQTMSDEDVRAVVSFLRSQPAVRHDTPARELTVLGKGLFSFVFGPMPPSEDPPARAPEEAATVERGRYIATSVALCVTCHTERNLQDGSYVGPRFAGGFRMPVDDDPSRVIVSPNLTPDPETGVVARWSEDEFVARFHEVGKTVPESHMPWSAYAQMSETDLRAVYRFLNSLEPVRNETGARVQPAE